MKTFEAIQIGERIELGSYHFSSEEIVRFAEAFDPQDFHLSEEAAQNGPFGRLAASGWHTAAIFMKLWIAYAKEEAERGGDFDPRNAGPSPGFEALKWVKPVFAGDTLTYTTEIIDKKESASRPEWGLVIMRNEAHKQDGELAYTFIGKVFVRREKPADGQ
ncbi:MaoC family dehydratase [Afifella marina]|uniref:Acyl dehydratase n=1 Tax=Afifella marina DSM 2698 TaxID=1120955 RepID=A0A1G5P2B9_AFIMA|nr:MaoC family dehydratase [Afifella marina]MBK1624219.1 dehydratase [Afifella marina DSM 2698]MBK1627952.1 dehydratase [Afifella marina]MBK5918146.1 dehydratase [Afifella marina]RAI19197.1 dehydratase [Afifella marina DSM 2698]SCZ43654.1 Acyl dehydratase [Afifella marina DSM 2698]